MYSSRYLLLYTNGNWGIAVTKAQMAFGVFLNDKKLYEDAIEFFLKGHDNGTLPNYVAESGQIQESGCLLYTSDAADE